MKSDNLIQLSGFLTKDVITNEKKSFAAFTIGRKIGEETMYMSCIAFPSQKFKIPFDILAKGNEVFVAGYLNRYALKIFLILWSSNKPSGIRYSIIFQRLPGLLLTAFFSIIIESMKCKTNLDLYVYPISVESMVCCMTYSDVIPPPKKTKIEDYWLDRNPRPKSNSLTRMCFLY